MRTREEQINSLWNSLTTEHWSSPEDEKLAREHILEAERRAEERVRADIAQDSSKHYPVHYAPVEGQTFPEMQEHTRSHPLYLMGDARLVWASEGDLYMPRAAVLVEKDKPSADAAREVV